MGTDKELLEELRREIKNKEKGELLDAYLKQSTATAIASKATKVLEEQIREIDRP
jgi:fibronectin type 3 domain-containing protein